MPNGDLQSAGELLLAAREEQGFTVEEVASQTRIRAKFITALETGDYGSLPSHTHARGFLRSYAQFLRVDVNTVLERFAQETGAEPRTMTQLTAEPAGYDPLAAAAAAAAGADLTLEDDDIPPLPDDTGAAPAAVPDGAVADGEISAEGVEAGEAAVDDDLLAADIIPPPPRSTYVPPAQRTGPGRPLTLTQPEKAAAPQPRTKKAPTPEQTGPRAFLRSNLFVAAVLGLGLVAIIWWVTTQLSQVSGEDLASATSAGTAVDSGQGSDLLPSPTFRLTSTPAPESGPQILDRVVLSLTVAQRTWSRIDVDGELAFEGASDPGEVLRFEGQDEIFVRTGNGAALEVNYNGQDLGLLGERGEVVERFFTLSGEVTPTPTLTITPTNTGVPTATPRTTATPEPTTAGVVRTAAPAITPTP